MGLPGVGCPQGPVASLWADVMEITGHVVSHSEAQQGLFEGGGDAVNRGFQNKRGQGFKKYLFIYLATLGLSWKTQHVRYLLCHAGSFQCRPRTLSLWHAGSVVVAHRHSCSTAWEILVLRPGMELTSTALKGGFFTTGPPSKSLKESFKKQMVFSYLFKHYFLIYSQSEKSPMPNSDAKMSANRTTFHGSSEKVICKGVWISGGKTCGHLSWWATTLYLALGDLITNDPFWQKWKIINKEKWSK